MNLAIWQFSKDFELALCLKGAGDSGKVSACIEDFDWAPFPGAHQWVVSDWSVRIEFLVELIAHL